MPKWEVTIVDVSSCPDSRENEPAEADNGTCVNRKSFRVLLSVEITSKCSYMVLAFPWSRNAK